MTKKIGKCALCGKNGTLTYEHIPPRAAFNSHPVKSVSVHDKIGDIQRLPWETNGIKFANLQKGMGGWTLCSECNSKTGTWYGAEYAEVARVAYCALQEYKTFDDSRKNDLLVLTGVHPLRFIKQVVSMFCSINDPDNIKFNELREFVLDKDKFGIDTKKYKLCMYFTDSHFRKACGEMGILRILPDGSTELVYMSEISAVPLGFILYTDFSDTYPYSGLDITNCADHRYDEVCDLKIPFILHEVNTVFPEDYRTKEEIIDDRDWHKKLEL